MNLKLKQGVKGEVANEGMGTYIYKTLKLKYLTHKIVTKNIQKILHLVSKYIVIKSQLTKNFISTYVLFITF